MTRSLMSFQGYAPGAIKTREQLLDLVIEARKSKRAIRLYAVGQGGYFSELFLTSRSAITTNKAGFDEVAVWARASKSYYRSSRCLGDLNIAGKDGRSNGYNRHQLFSNRRSAMEYAQKLKDDAPYQAAVAAWHKRCAEIFSPIPRWF